MDLKKVISSVQSVSEAISSVMNVDVTVVDKQRVRIAGTGCYKEAVGQKVTENSVFALALEKGESYVIENPRQHPVCLKCGNIAGCSEHAEVCCPIKLNGTTLGVIGLVAFDEAQRSALVGNQINLMNFLSRMAELISSKVLEQENTDRIELLAGELEILLDTVDRGIIAVDRDGGILRFNRNAMSLFKLDEEKLRNLNIMDLIEDLDLDHLLSKEDGVRNKEFICRKGSKHIRGLYDAKPICIGAAKVGLVLTFSPISDVLNIINKISIGTIDTRLADILGSSECLARVKKEAEKAAQSSSTVLILGESGTGKELFARAIHYHSSRGKGPFIPINCSAIPEQLLESELFGYEDGAFTGARKGGKAGKFELANKGTLFLDEIGDMQLHLQAKLLRVLQERVIEKVGGKDNIPIDVRVIAATNKDLEKKVLEGEFRQDLYYRLNVVPLSIPALRERDGDVEILVTHFLQKCSEKLGKNIEKISQSALTHMISYDWPGNIRELENAVEYAVNMCSTGTIEVDDLPGKLRVLQAMVRDISTDTIIPVTELERQEIAKALKLYGKSGKALVLAAKALGLGRATLYRKIKEYGLD